MWQYIQATGELFNPDSVSVGQGYSGHPPHVNDGDAEQIHGVGPAPRGVYTFSASFDDGHLGQVVMALEPVAPFDAYGRTLLRIHGDNAAMNQTASDGCIILARPLRELLDASDDRTLQIV